MTGEQSAPKEIFEFADEDIERYICIWRDRDKMDFRDIAKIMDLDLINVVRIYLNCVCDGRRDRFMRQLTPFGKKPINWNSKHRRKSDAEILMEELMSRCSE